MSEYERNYEFKLIKDMLVNDCHIHIRDWNDGIENGYNFMEQLEKFRTDFKVSKMNIVCIPFYYTRDVCQNILSAILKLEYPEYYVHGGIAYHSQPVTFPFPDGFTPKEQLEDMMSIGLDGIKMIETKPNYQKLLGVTLSDSVYEPYFQKLEEDQIHVLCHASDPEKFWDEGLSDPNHPEWLYCGDGYMSFEEIHKDIYKVLERHPNLKITFAHMFFLEKHPDTLIDLFEKYPNINIDICPNTMMYGIMSNDLSTWREFFTKYSDRILFGTDYCSASGNIPTIGHDNVYRFLLTDDEYKFWNGMEAHGLNLDKSVVQKILGTNFCRILGNKSKPINKDALKNYIKKYEPVMTNMEQKEYIMTYCKEHKLL